MITRVKQHIIISTEAARLQNSQFFFLKISKEFGKAWRESLFSASFQTFCFTARAYLNVQKYRLFSSLTDSMVFPFSLLASTTDKPLGDDNFQ